MKKLIVLCLFLGVCALCAAAVAQQGQAPTPSPKYELVKAIERGKALFNDPKLGTTAQSCNDCHIEGGMKDSKMGKMDVKAFSNVGATYPKYFMMASKVVTLDQMVNWCIVTPMKGTALPWDDQRLADLVAYVVSVKPPAPPVKTPMPAVKPAETPKAPEPKK